jgi:hypothetical protein
MSPETARRIKENIHLLNKKDYYNFLCQIPYIDLEEVISMLLRFGVKDPFNGHYPTLKELFRDVAEYQFPPSGTHFATAERVVLPLHIGWIGDVVVDYINNLYHRASSSTRKLAEDIVAMWDDLDSWNDISDYWINRINELFYEADNWKIELIKDKTTGDVCLVILPKSEVKVTIDDNEYVIWCEGLYFNYDSTGLDDVKIKFDRFEAE